MLAHADTSVIGGYPLLFDVGGSRFVNGSASLQAEASINRKVTYDNFFLDSAFAASLTQNNRLQHKLIKELENKVGEIEKYYKNILCNIQIYRLPNIELIVPLNIIIEPDDSGFIARNPDLPLYGYGEDVTEAIEMLKQEIESLYDDLMQGDDYTDEWLEIKKFYNKIINKK